MFHDTPAMSSFSVNDLAAAKQFYGETLGLAVEETAGMGLTITPANGGGMFIYPKEDHTPASFTIINFVVTDIQAAVSDLVARGVSLEHYPDMHQDDAGIAWGKQAHMGPNIAWFKDPAGNILAVLEN